MMKEKCPSCGFEFECQGKNKKPKFESRMFQIKSEKKEMCVKCDESIPKNTSFWKKVIYEISDNKSLTEKETKFYCETCVIKHGGRIE